MSAHEKIATALEQLATAFEGMNMPVAQPQAVQMKVAAENKDVQAKFRKMTGTDLPPEVASNAVAADAIRKLAAASTPINQLGEPAHDDPNARRNGKEGRTREERRKAAFDSFGDDLINGPNR